MGVCSEYINAFGAVEWICKYDFGGRKVDN